MGLFSDNKSVSRNRFFTRNNPSDYLSKLKYSIFDALRPSFAGNASCCEGEVMITIVNDCSNPATLVIIASGLSSDGDLFNLQEFNGTTWETITMDPFLVNNGSSTQNIDAILYSVITLRVINVSGTIISNIATNEACPPELALSVVYDCTKNDTSETITYAGIPDGTTIKFEYSADGGLTWPFTLDNPIMTDGSGEQTNGNHVELANGDYLIRAISDDETIESNHFPITINCTAPYITIDGASYDCNTGNFAVDYTLTSIHDTQNITFKFGLGDPNPWLNTWVELGIDPGSHTTYTNYAPANNTYVIIAIITDANGTHTSVPFEIIINCP